MADLTPSQNAPVTAASITAASGLVLAAFTSFTTEQVTATQAVVGILAAVIVQRFSTIPRPKD